MMRYLIGILCIAVFQSFGQTNCHLTIRGKIIDANSNLPIEFAFIAIDSSTTITTNNDGKFIFEKQCNGLHAISATHIGCEPFYLSVNFKKDTSIIIKLYHKEHDLTTVVIERHKTETAPSQPVEVLSGNKLLSLQGQNLSNMLAELPGVQTLATGSTISKPVIHGLHSNRILIIQNGIRMEGQQWGLEHGVEIDPFIAQKITVIKGANALRFGSDAIGGVVLIESGKMPFSFEKNLQLNYVFSTADVGHQLNALYEQHFKKLPLLSWRIQAGGKIAGNMQTPNYRQQNTAANEQSLLTQFAIKKSRFRAELLYSFYNTSLGILANSHIGNAADLQKAIANPSDSSAPFSYLIGRPKQAVMHHLAKAFFHLQTGNVGSLKLTVGYQYNLRKEYDKFLPRNNALAAENPPANQFAIQTINTNIAWEHIAKKGFTGGVYADFITQTNNIRYGYFIPPYWSFNPAITWIERWTGEKIEIEAGARFDYKWLQAYTNTAGLQEKPIRQFAVPSFMVGMDYHITKNISWNINFASAWRAPAVNELYSNGVHHSAASYEIGDKALRAEQAYSATTSLEANHEFFSIHISGYVNRINNFIYLLPDTHQTLTIRGVFPTFRYVQTDALLSGADIVCKVMPTKGLEVGFQSSLLFARDLHQKDWLAQMPPQRFEYSLRYEIPFYKMIKSWHIAAKAIQVLKQYHLPNNYADYLPAPNGYTLLNIETGLSVAINNQPINFILAVNNVTNAVYRNYLNRFRYFTDEAGVNAMLKINIPIQFKQP